MNQQNISQLKTNIIAIGHLLWEKDLASGLNGNISVRLEADSLLLTGHGTCLGLLQEKDILSLQTDGQLLEEGRVSTENLLHREIYKNFPDVQAVVHTHTTFTNGYFLENEVLAPRIFESKFYLGDVKSVPQSTPSVTDAAPVIGALKSNSIVVLRNHGVVAMGKELFDCFLLIQALEDAVKVDVVAKLFSAGHKSQVTSHKRNTKKVASNELRVTSSQKDKKYKLFSKEQIKEIVKLVNGDEQMRILGEKTDMTMDLAVQMEETKQTYNFAFRKGNIAKVTNDDNAEFLITAPESVWRAVFNREIDPFVATTQKKMNLRGDFAKISKWYAPCSRVFELWQQIPVE